jgi:sugar lactone lactonase YvrE
VAGSGERGYAGDNGSAINAKLNQPTAVAIDKTGNLYIADNGNHRIRKVAADGTITTFAGTGERGFGGDGGLAVKALFNRPYGVQVDPQGNVLIADQGNNRIRKITADGRISTVAGNGTQDFSGDGGLATSASLSQPNDVTADKAGNLYIADSGNHRVRKVTPDGRITTIAGTGQLRYNGESGYSGDGGRAIKARLNLPSEVIMDGMGNLYIGDFSNHTVRKITPDGIISTVAGTGKRGFNGDNIPAIQAQLNEPGGIALALDGSLLIADGINYRIRRVGFDGIIQTIAGNGKRAYSGDGGAAASAELSVLDIITIRCQRQHLRRRLWQ